MSQAVLDHIKTGLYDMAFQDIKKAASGHSKMGAFILASCFIEYMAGFAYGKATTRKDYKNLIIIKYNFSLDVSPTELVSEYY